MSSKAPKKTSKSPRRRINIMGPGGQSLSRDTLPLRKERVSSRKRQGKKDMTRREYYGR